MSHLTFLQYDIIENTFVLETFLLMVFLLCLCLPLLISFEVSFLLSIP